MSSSLAVYCGWSLSAAVGSSQSSRASISLHVLTSQTRRYRVPGSSCRRTVALCVELKRKRHLFPALRRLPTNAQEKKLSNKSDKVRESTSLLHCHIAIVSGAPLITTQLLAFTFSSSLLFGDFSVTVTTPIICDPEIQCSAPQRQF